MTIVDAKMMQDIDRVFEKAASQGRTTFYEFEIYDILNKIGIHTPKFLFAKDPVDVSEQAIQGFGERIVVKIVSPDIAHKQKLGGVKILKAWDLSVLQTVMAEMKTEVLSHFSGSEQPRIEGFLLVEFVPYSPSIGNETMIGCREDGEFGPIVLVSKGGEDAEFFAKHYDHQHLPASLGAEEARDFVRNLNISRKLGGKDDYIGHMTPCRVSQLSHHY